MGAYQIWNIEFKDKKSRKYFENLKLHKKILCAYCYFNDETIPKGLKTRIITYFIGWEGYALGSDFLRKHIKKLDIKKFYSLDLSTRSTWYNELKNYKIYNDEKRIVELETKLINKKKITKK